MESIVRRNGKVRVVKNLGWLLRNWKKVESFIVMTKKDGGAELVAVLCSPYWTYETPFAYKGILRKFLDRPVFRGLIAEWDAEKVQIGSKEWREYKG
jgi:hypothetical protein